MKLSASISVKRGFSIYTLKNGLAEVAVVPELGARVISLKNVKTGREWMSHPPGRLKLFRNQTGDAFLNSPLVGMDECLPTIAACQWGGRLLPDHGEAWSVAWRLDEGAWEQGKLRTTASLKISPFDFERTIELRGNKISLSYALRNRAAKDEPFLWALHPLMKVQRGDQLMLPKSTRAMMNGKAWGEELGAAIPEGECEKIFVGPLRDGGAGIYNPRTGDRIDFDWCEAENNSLGLWLTRGGWHGHHHFAIEPSNGDADALSHAAERQRCGVLPGKGVAKWQVHFRIGP